MRQRHITRGLVAFALVAATLSTARAEEPSPDELVFRALSVRHDPPDCATVEAMSPTPVETLLRMVEEVQQPPWVPMRAAECLTLRHHERIPDRLDRWVVEPQLRGLGMLVVARLDDLPVPTARALAERALTRGPDPDRTRAHLRRLNTPELRALAEVEP